MRGSWDSSGVQHYLLSLPLPSTVGRMSSAANVASASLLVVHRAISVGGIALLQRDERKPPILYLSVYRLFRRDLAQVFWVAAPSIAAAMPDNYAVLL
jgi:hypothetical protein